MSKNVLSGIIATFQKYSFVLPPMSLCQPFKDSCHNRTIHGIYVWFTLKLIKYKIINKNVPKCVVRKYGYF